MSSPSGSIEAGFIGHPTTIRLRSCSTASRTVCCVSGMVALGTLLVVSSRVARDSYQVLGSNSIQSDESNIRRLQEQTLAASLEVDKPLVASLSTWLGELDDHLRKANEPDVLTTKTTESPITNKSSFWRNSLQLWVEDFMSVQDERNPKWLNTSTLWTKHWGGGWGWGHSHRRKGDWGWDYRRGWGSGGDWHDNDLHRFYDDQGEESGVESPRDTWVDALSDLLLKLGSLPPDGPYVDILFDQESLSGLDSSRPRPRRSELMLANHTDLIDTLKELERTLVTFNDDRHLKLSFLSSALGLNNSTFERASLGEVLDASRRSCLQHDKSQSGSVPNIQSCPDLVEQLLTLLQDAWWLGALEEWIHEDKASEIQETVSADWRSNDYDDNRNHHDWGRNRGGGWNHRGGWGGGYNPRPWCFWCYR